MNDLDGELESRGFAGRGWGFPPEFGSREGMVRMVSGTRAVEESLYLLLSTVPGERVMRPDYGCALSTFMFRELTSELLGDAQVLVEAAVLKWEPRIELVKVSVATHLNEPGQILITINCKLRSTGAFAGFVFPFSINVPEAA